MIEIANPEAFLLLPLWGLGCWLLPKAQLRNPLRVLLLLLLMLAWADPFINRSSPGLDLWVLNDMALSAQESVQPGMAELETLLKESKGREWIGNRFSRGRGEERFRGCEGCDHVGVLGK
jgi:hypothetical protein